MKSKTIWILFALMFVLHQDFWWWDDTTLVLGFLPVGLAYHAGFSIAAGLLWFGAVKFAWPSELEQWANESDADAEGGRA